MAQLKEFEVDGKRFVFHNESVGNRSGFFHKSELFINDYFFGDAKIQYYNRTWESYQFQTSMRRVLFDAIETRKTELKGFFKEDRKIKSLRGQAKIDFEIFMENDDELKLLTKAVDIL